jgi:hypothetical protein
MRRIVVTSAVDKDGALHLSLPLSKADANKVVRVTVEVPAEPPMSQDEWRRCVEEMAGSITDPTFRRWEQGEYEKRDPLP